LLFLTKIQRSLPITLVLFCSFCLLPSAFSETQSEAGQLQASPSPTPSTSPLPSPSPTPVTGLHQWGAVTLFHGLPSDRVHAIAQGADGSMWFGTEAGLAKFDGRRTQTITISGLAAGRVIALQSDQTGAIWVGTQTGAARMFWGHFDVVTETLGQTVTTIIAPDPGRVLLATEQGNIYETRTAADGSIQTKSLLTQPLESADREHPGPLVITSLAVINNKLVAGSMSRGLLTIEDGMAREVETRPSLFFIRALELDGKGRL
jgi:ligand-binding sensor domain-containing protein